MEMALLYLRVFGGTPHFVGGAYAYGATIPNGALAGRHCRASAMTARQRSVQFLRRG